MRTEDDSRSPPFASNSRWKDEDREEKTDRRQILAHHLLCRTPDGHVHTEDEVDMSTFCSSVFFECVV